MTNAKNFGAVFKGPDHIGLDITNMCNMHCLHCYNRSNVGGGANICRELTDAELVDFAKELKSLEPHGFCFCGGEPLLRYSILVKMLKEMQNDITHPAIVTNGYLMTQAKADELKQLGLYTLQVSIDGSDSATHDRLRGVNGCYEHALAAIKMGHQAEIPNRAIAFSPTAFNVTQFPEVVRKMAELKVNEIRVQPLMRLGEAVNHDEMLPSLEQYRSLHQTILRLKKIYPHIRFEWGDPIDHLFRCAEVISGFVPFVTIVANGDIVLSPYLPISIGNVRRHPLRAYWDAEIWRIWECKFFKSLAQTLQSCADFSRVDVPVPKVFYSVNITLDLIDDKLLTLSDEDIAKLYWDRVVISDDSLRALCKKYEREPYIVNRRDLLSEMVGLTDDMNAICLAYGKCTRPETIIEVKRDVDKHLRALRTTLTFDLLPIRLKPDRLSDMIDFIQRQIVKVRDSQYVRLGMNISAMSGFLTRGRMFNETHYYYALVDAGNQIHALVSICIGIQSSLVAYVDLFIQEPQIVSAEYCRMLISYVKKDLPSLSAKEIGKLRLVLMPTQEMMVKIAIACGFVKRAALDGGMACDLYDLEIRENEG